MAKRRGRKRVIQKAKPTESKSVRQTESPERSDHLTITWRVSAFDWAGSWGETALAETNLTNLVRDFCHNLESMTWAEIYRASGGRRDGNNHHPIDIRRLSKTATDRLSHLRREDLESIVSLRINGTTRLYGIRDSRAFCALWFDPWHDDAKRAVCPVRQN